MIIFGVSKHFQRRRNEETKKKIFRQSRKKYLQTFSSFTTISIYQKWIGTTLSSPNVNVQVASRAAKGLLRPRIFEKLRIDEKTPARSAKAKFWQLCYKHFKETSILLYYANVSILFCSWLTFSFFLEGLAYQDLSENSCNTSHWSFESL